MREKSYAVFTSLTVDELKNGLENKCMSCRKIRWLNPLGEKIDFFRFTENGRIVLMPSGNSRNSARGNHHLTFTENENGTLIEVAIKFDPLVIFFVLIWWILWGVTVRTVIVKHNYYILPGAGVMALFHLLLTWLSCKKADEELPKIKQAFRELIAEIEVDCEK